MYWNKEFGRYLEPFVGSGSLFYSINPANAILGDINRDLVDCLQTIQKFPEAVYKKLTALPTGKRSYYKIRATDPTGAKDRAARFLFLNRFCFNGLYRTNLNGQFNVPFAPTGTGKIPPRKVFLASARRLKNAKIECADFEMLVRRHAKRGDFVYFDPPYAVSARRIFTEYDSNVFGKKDLDRLVRLLHHLDKAKITWVLSYAYSKESLDAFGKWTQEKLFAQRNIAGFAKHRRKAAELLISNRK